MKTSPPAFRAGNDWPFRFGPMYAPFRSELGWRPSVDREAMGGGLADDKSVMQRIVWGHATDTEIPPRLRANSRAVKVLKQTPPASTVRLLAADHAVKPEDIVLCTDTDIDRIGKYQPQWLAVTSDKAFVLSDGPAPKI